MDDEQKAFIMSSMRRASYRWVGRYTAEKRSHVGRNQYVCEGCGEVFTKKETQMDHIMPVVPVTGWDNIENWLVRLLVREAGWQRLCKDKCHRKKTDTENEQRYTNKVVERKIRAVKATKKAPAKKSKKKSRRK